MRASLRRAVLAAIVTACVFSGAAGAYATDVKIASFRSFVFFPVWVAKEGGFFERESLNAELLFFSSGTEMTSALLSQSVDFASTMADRPMLLKDRGQETRHLIALTTQAPYTLVVPLADTLKYGDIASLKGKRIAITQKGSATDVAMRALLRPMGVDPDRDLILLALGTHENGIAALKAGQADVVILSEPATTVPIDQEKIGKAFLDLRKGEGPSGASRSTFGTLQATEQYVRNKGDNVKRAISAVCKATKAIRAQPDQWVWVAKKYFPNIDDTVLRRALEGEASSYGSQITAQMIDSVSEINQAVAVIKRGYAMDDVVVSAEYRSLWNC